MEVLDVGLRCLSNHLIVLINCQDLKFNFLIKISFKLWNMKRANVRNLISLCRSRKTLFLSFNNSLKMCLIFINRLHLILILFMVDLIGGWSCVHAKHPLCLCLSICNFWLELLHFDWILFDLACLGLARDHHYSGLEAFVFFKAVRCLSKPVRFVLDRGLCGLLKTVFNVST